MYSDIDTALSFFTKPMPLAEYKFSSLLADRTWGKICNRVSNDVLRDIIATVPHEIREIFQEAFKRHLEDWTRDHD